MTKQEIIDELNAACLHGLDRWVEASDGGFAAASPGRTVYLHPEEAHREAAALRRKREALSLDAVMPLLERIASDADELGEDDDAPAWHYLDRGAAGKHPENIPTAIGDVRAVVEAWKARRS